MKISVIVPCYNAGPYLAQTIGSVLEQSRRADEIIIVDDGSTDGSLDIARRFGNACGADWVRVYSERSGSAARTRNLGAALATGDALMFLDADDVLAPDALESLAEALADRPGGIVACPWRRLAFENGAWISQPASCARRRPDQDALSAWLTGWYYPPCAVLWSKEAFLQTGGWDEETTLNDDGDLMMRALVSGIPLIETAAGTAYYRRLPDGQTSLSGKRYTYGGIAGRIAVIEKVARMLEEQDRIEPYRSSLRHTFGLIAADAAGHFDGLGQQARTDRRQYGPSLWSRVLSLPFRGRWLSRGTQPIAAPPRDRVETIRFGIDCAESVLAPALANAEPDDAILRPLPHRPAVSVIIPAYNCAHLLPRTLDGVLKQTLTDFEVLIVDDCSQDDPASVVAGVQDPRLRYLRQPQNRGVAAARNRGLREARAPFIAFLDGDDEWFPEKLALQVELFRRSPQDVGLIYTGVETLTNAGSTLQIPSARGDLYRELLVRNILHGGGSNVMMRSNAVASIGFFDETLPAIEDYDYWLRLSRHYKIECISTPLVRYHDCRQPLDGKQSRDRRSLNIQANVEARDQFYKKHGKQMREAGLAHLFLATSAWRNLVPEWNDRKAARRLALRAFLQAPFSWATRNVLVQSFGTEEVLEQFKRPTESGLSSAEVRDRRKRYGFNRLRQAKVRPAGGLIERICYVLNLFPQPSETFISDEAVSMIDLGVTPYILSLNDSDSSSLHPSAKRLIDSNLVTNITTKSKQESLKAVFRLFLARPRNTLSVFAKALLGADDDRWRYFQAAPYAHFLITKKVNFLHVHFADHHLRWAEAFSEWTEIPLGVTTHGYDLRDDPISVQDASRLFSEVDLVATISEYNKSLMIKKYGIFPDLIKVIHCGVDVDRFKPKNNATKLKNNKLNILNIGRLVHLKGQDILLRALAEAKERGVQFELKIIGAGPLLSNLSELAKSLGILEQVHFLGAQDQDVVIKILREADIFVLASRIEGLPVACMEAMAMKVFTIAPRICGVPELISDKENGLLFEPEDVQGLADAVCWADQNREALKEMTDAARSKVEKYFNREKCTRMLVDEMATIRPRYFCKPRITWL